MRSEELPEPLRIDGHTLSSLNSIEKKIETFWDRPLLQHYTNHGIDHSQRIIEALGNLLEDFTNLLKQRERFILLASIYLHDIGMQSPQHAGLPKKTEYTLEEMERIREVHNESSAQMIKESIVSGSQLLLGLDNCKGYASFIADVSRFHRTLDLTKLDNTSIAGEPVRLQLLAALLRLGDALDADHRRVNMDYLSLREIPVESKYHWWCHHYVQSVLIQKRRIELYFWIPEEYRNDEVVDVIEKRVKESMSKPFFDVYDILDGYGIRLYRDIEIKKTEYLSEGSLQMIPVDLREFIEVRVLQTVEHSEHESARTGLVWYADGVPFSDDADIVKCLSEVFSLIEEERYLDAAEKIAECRLLTMIPKDKMIFLIVAGNCYFTLGKLAEAEKSYRDALTISERQDLQHIYERVATQVKSVTLGNIGAVCREKGDLDQARRYYNDALEIDRNIGYKQGEAADLGNIGLIFMDEGHLDEALKYFRSALEIHKEIECRKEEARGLGNIGAVYKNKGDLNQALKYHNDALKIHRQIGYKQGEAIQLGNIGFILSIKGDFDQALKYHNDALKIHRQIGYKQGEAIQLGNIGLIHSYRGNQAQALNCLNDALRIDREIENRRGEASDLGNIGTVYYAENDLDEALRYFKNALEIYKEIGYRKEEAIQLGNVGVISWEKKELDEALGYHEAALKIFEVIGYRVGEADQLGSIGLVYAEKRDFDTAFKYLKNALEIDEEIVYKQGEAKLLYNMGMILDLSGEINDALKYLNKSLDVFSEIGMEREANKASNQIREICLRNKS